MRFYRPLGQISALTFDLDDTLYDNRPTPMSLISCVRRCWLLNLRFIMT